MDGVAAAGVSMSREDELGAVRYQIERSKSPVSRREHLEPFRRIMTRTSLLVLPNGQVDIYSLELICMKSGIRKTRQGCSDEVTTGVSMHRERGPCAADDTVRLQPATYIVITQ